MKILFTAVSMFSLGYFIGSVLHWNRNDDPAAPVFTMAVLGSGVLAVFGLIVLAAS